jgi:hypothetical protein|tara:strand:- start:213 stop:377 length:165 start_codon:yes stop_codon:yes gene_type:complete
MANSKIRLNDAVAIGISGMVGGGIFAVLGLAVSLAKGGSFDLNIFLQLVQSLKN